MIARLPESSAPSLIDRGIHRPLHVVHLIEALGPGGAERLLYTNLKHLDKTRIRSTVMTVFPHATHWVEPIRELDISVTSLNCKGPGELLSGIKSLRRWLRVNRPDVIHSHLWAANIIGRVAGRLSHVPVISSIHNPDHEIEAWEDGSNVGMNKRRAIKSLDRWTARFGCERMIAVSDYVKQSAHRHLGYPLERIELLYNPIDVESLGTSATNSREHFLREWGLPEDALVLLNVARVSPQKGLLHAVRAMPAILERHPEAHLVSVGATTDPEWLARLQAEAKELGVDSHFHVLGARRDVPSFLRNCDVFVFPSLYEGLGIALIEAMAAGCACVATTAGPIPEIVQHGRDALLVSPESSTELANAVCSLLENPERSASLGAAAKRTALERFQPQAAADQLASIYRAVVDESQSASRNQPRQTTTRMSGLGF
ncbi:MAG: glycosyltransferase family 4 protein [Acidobacteriota bacterium]|nr:glycosyltransferase family 4 protein [Acidobacteriota bacterium]